MIIDKPHKNEYVLLNYRINGVDTILHGRYQLFKNNKLKEDRNYVLGKPYGAFKQYFENGKIEVVGFKRETLGTKSAKDLRNASLVPCVLYGGQDVVHFAVPMILFRDLIYTPEVAEVELNIEGEIRRAILQDSQFHPVNEVILNVDFLEIVDGKAIKIDVPVKIVGNAPGVQKGGKMVQKLRKVTLKGLAEENLQARVRGTALMGISNQEGHLILATGNKSELACGYSTLYGDAVGGFAPIKDIYKTDVWALSRYRNALAIERGETPPIPDRSITKEPSAELRPDQKDSDSLPDYPLLDQVLRAYVDEDHGYEALLAQGFESILHRGRAVVNAI